MGHLRHPGQMVSVVPRLLARYAKRGMIQTAHNVCRISVTYGHPHMIDVQDCDARLPSSGDPQDLYLDELVRLSVILGRVQKAIYTCVRLPFGMQLVRQLIRRIRQSCRLECHQ